MKPAAVYGLAALVFLLDRLSKMLVVKRFDYITNYGAAFGILQHQTTLFLVVGVAVSIALLYYIKKYSYPELGFLLGGTLGNLLDRMTQGYVIDFIDFKVWPSFNIADTFNTIAVILLIYRWEIKPRMRKLYKGNSL